MENSWKGLALVHGSKLLIYRTMPAPDRNQSDALSIRLIPDRYPLMLVLQGDHHLLAPRYRSTDIFSNTSCIFLSFLTQISLLLFTVNSWTGLAIVHGSRPTAYRTMPAPDRNQSDALSIGPIPDRYPLIVVQGDYQLLALRYRYT